MKNFGLALRYVMREKLKKDIRAYADAAGLSVDTLNRAFKMTISGQLQKGTFDALAAGAEMSPSEFEGLLQESYAEIDSLGIEHAELARMLGKRLSKAAARQTKGPNTRPKRHPGRDPDEGRK